MNTYPQEKIINPPQHTKEEIGEIVNRINEKNDREIVDFGAGSGRITIPLLQRGFKVYAVDVSETSLSDLNQLAKSLGLDNIKVLKELPRDKTFSSIVGADILHHVDLDVMLSIFYKSLKKGGKIVFSEPSAFNPSWYLYLPIASSWSIEKGLLNLRYFNIIKKLKDNGFIKVKISGVGLLPLPLFNFSDSLSRINNLIGNLPILKLFAYRYIIEAYK